MGWSAGGPSMGDHCGRNPTYKIGALLADNPDSNSTHSVDFELERPIATSESRQRGRQQ